MPSKDSDEKPKMHCKSDDRMSHWTHLRTFSFAFA